MPIWNHGNFKGAVENLKSIDDVEKFVSGLSNVVPVRQACFRYWRNYTSDELVLEFANYPRHATAESKDLRYFRQDRLSRYAFERILPINWMEEIDRNTEMGQLLAVSLQHGHLATGFTIVVRGPGGEGGLFIGDCEHDSVTWIEEFERVNGTIQLMAQSLFLVVQRFARQTREILTPREKDCLSLAAQGRTVKQIARELGLSDQTITFYLGRVRLKLAVSNTTEAVAKAVKSGMLG